MSEWKRDCTKIKVKTKKERKRKEVGVRAREREGALFRVTLNPKYTHLSCEQIV